jgi:hypothetical protein
LKPEFNLKRWLMDLQVTRCGVCARYGLSDDCYWCHGTGLLVERDNLRLKVMRFLAGSTNFSLM